MLNRKLRILFLVLCMIGVLVGISNAGFASGIVRVSSTFPVLIDPATGADFQSIMAIVNLYDPLISMDYEGNIIPHIADSWNVSPDGLTYTFHLRSGIKFYDGRELTAEDVKFSMDRTLAIGEGNAYIWRGKIKEIEVVDKYTVVFHMETVFGPFLNSLLSFFIVNKDLVKENITTGSYGDMGDYGKTYILDNAVGSGAYMIEDFKRAEYLLMKKNPNYFLAIDPLAPDQFKMIASTEEVAVKTMMANRDLEMTNIWMTGETLEFLSKIDGIELCELTLGNQEFFTMNTTRPPLDDIHVRKALAWAFDYDAAKKLVPASSQPKGPTPQILSGSCPDCFQYHRDLEKAKAELKRSKYYGKFDQYPIEAVWFSSVTREKMTMLLMANAAEIGLNINIIKTTWSLLSQNVTKPETTPFMYLIQYNPAYPEAISLIEGRYHSRGAGTWAQGEWLRDPKLDKMIDDVLSTPDKDERYAKTREVAKYIVDLCPSIFVIEAPSRSAYQAVYMDWPAAKGEVVPAAYNYQYRMRFIKMYPEKREALLKK